MTRLLLAFIFVACSSAPKTPSLALQRTGAHADPRIGTYISSEKGFLTSSYWIEGPQGLILIDTQFLTSAAEEFVDFAEKTTGKKAVLAIVLHPNPDKFNGTAVFQKRGIKVVTSEQIKKLIPAVHKLRMGWFFERFKPDYPKDEPSPEVFGNATQEIKAAGLTIKAHVMGPGCSEAHVVVEFEKHLFPGDLVTNDFHSWLELGLINEWLARVDELNQLDIDNVHPGRGPSGSALLLIQQKQYLDLVKASFAKENLKGKPSQKDLDRVRDRIFDAYPGYDYDRFVENGLAATWANFAKKR